jgi:hypothetical protein
MAMYRLTTGRHGEMRLHTPEPFMLDAQLYNQGSYIYINIYIYREREIYIITAVAPLRTPQASIPCARIASRLRMVSELQELLVALVTGFQNGCAPPRVVYGGAPYSTASFAGDRGRRK